MIYGLLGFYNRAQSPKLDRRGRQMRSALLELEIRRVVIQKSLLAC